MSYINRGIEINPSLKNILVNSLSYDDDYDDNEGFGYGDYNYSFESL